MSTVPPTARWVVSSYSGAQQNCVAVAHTSVAVGVRDSKNPEAGTLAFDRASWLSFSRSFKG